MKKNEPISKVMTASPISVHHGDPLSKVRQQFEQHEIHHLPVVSGQKLVGIISWSDLLRVSFGEYGNQDDRGLDAVLDHTYRLEDLMNPNPIAIEVSASIRDAAEILGEKDFHSLPVVEGGNLVGIITSTDLIRYLYDLF